MSKVQTQDYAWLLALDTSTLLAFFITCYRIPPICVKKNIILETYRSCPVSPFSKPRKGLPTLSSWFKWIHIHIILAQLAKFAVSHDSDTQGCCKKSMIFMETAMKSTDQVLVYYNKRCTILVKELFQWLHQIFFFFFFLTIKLPFLFPFFLVKESLGKGKLPHTRAKANRKPQRGLTLDLQISHQGGLLAVELKPKPFR